MENVVTITYETPVAEIERVAKLIGEGLKPKFAAADYPHACSDLIHLSLITNLSEIATKLSLPLSELKGNRKFTRWWIGGMPTMRVLMNAIPQWCNLDLNILNAPIIKSRSAKDLEALPQDISTGCYLFCMFAVWYGAKPECKRVILNNRATKVLNNAMKKMGANGILSQMYIAATEYVVLGEKVFEPEWQKMISGRDDTKVNSMSARSVASTVSRGRVRQVSSFADLASLKS